MTPTIQSIRVYFVRFYHRFDLECVEANPGQFDANETPRSGETLSAQALALRFPRVKETAMALLSTQMNLPNLAGALMLGLYPLACLFC